MATSKIASEFWSGVHRDGANVWADCVTVACASLDEMSEASALATAHGYRMTYSEGGDTGPTSGHPDEWRRRQLPFAERGLPDCQLTFRRDV